MQLSPTQKALEINLNEKLYGTFAEIGAGQEVARNFFRAGGAAGTVAKTMSAYDMIISDTIYGAEKSGRYVCETRIMKMLDHEYKLLDERLNEHRGDRTKFFVFADTVAAMSYSGKGDCHGWLGVRFQHQVGAAPSDLIVHIRMNDKENLQQQEAIGILGVNMIYACFNHAGDTDKFITTLMENLSTRRVEIDMIKISGDAFEIDPQLLSFELVKRKYCKAIMFDGNGEIVQARDTLYKKNVIVSRGSFRPPTHVNMDMLSCGKGMFEKELAKEEHEHIMVLAEISMSKLLQRGEVDSRDFLARVQLLSSLGQNVLITSFDNYFELNTYLAKSCKKQVRFVSGLFNLEEILGLTNYKESPFGIMGGLGSLFGHTTRMYVYPTIDDHDDKKFRTIKDLKFDESLSKLVNYLEENHLIEDVTDSNPEYSKIWSRTVLRMIEAGESGWESMVPAEVAKIVKEKKLFS